MTFAGFPAAALDFYAGLQEENTREWWREHRETYDRAVAGPLRELAELLTDEFGAPKIFRPYRDLRFSSDKRPLQEHASLVVEPPDGSGSFYLQLSADGLLTAGGWWHPAPAQLGGWRRAVDDDATAEGLDRVLAGLERRGYRLDDEGVLKTAPRGWPRDHPRIDLIRRTDLAVSRHERPEPWLHTAACADHVRDGWRAVRGWNHWLHEHAGH